MNNEIVYSIKGHIKTSIYTKICFHRDWQFFSVSNTNVTIHSSVEDQLDVLMSLEANSVEEARKIALLELSRIIDVLSFTFRTLVENYCVTEITSYDLPKARFVIRSATAKACMKLQDICIEQKDLEKLDRTSGKMSDAKCEDALNMLREAQNKGSVEKFFHLYRLLEFLLGNREDVDKWLLNKEPTVEIKAWKNKDWTIYTYLRDNIHSKPEMRRFPVKEIEYNLGKFEQLARFCIMEKFDI